jgi:hypothetical protein
MIFEIKFKLNLKEVNETNMAGVDVDKNIQTVAHIIQQNGKPNKQFPKDLDLDYGTLSKHANFGGVGTILKTMKKKVISICSSYSCRKWWTIRITLC